jgi:hypothetical protein
VYMSRRYFILFPLIYGLIIFSTKIYSQINPEKNQADKKTISNNESLLFDNKEIFHFKITARLSELFNDRNQNISYHAISVQYYDKDSSLISLQLKARVRGHFRRRKENCKMPPLMLDFSKGEKLKNSVFENQHQLKLVVPCQGDEYIIREWLVYKLYNLITPKSFKAALVQVDFQDSSHRRKTETHYCILLEDEKKMALRNKARIINEKTLLMQNTNKSEFTNMAVFEYMVANTDWSVPYLQNIKIISTDSTKPPYTVPYDFDHAGIVDAPYAGAAPELGISSVRERIYRGYCNNDKQYFTETFALFNKLKNEIYNVYTSCTLLNPKYLKFVTKFLDDFYRTINSNKLAKTEFESPCRTNVRIELKGLDE